MNKIYHGNTTAPIYTITAQSTADTESVFYILHIAGYEIPALSTAGEPIFIDADDTGLYFNQAVFDAGLIPLYADFRPADEFYGAVAAAEPKGDIAEISLDEIGSTGVESIFIAAIISAAEEAREAEEEK